MINQDWVLMDNRPPPDSSRVLTCSLTTGRIAVGEYYDYLKAWKVDGVKGFIPRDNVWFWMRLPKTPGEIA